MKCLLRKLASCSGVFRSTRDEGRSFFAHTGRKKHMEGLTSPFYDKDWPLWHSIASCISGYRIAIWSFRYPFLRHRRAGPLAVFAFAVASAHITINHIVAPRARSSRSSSILLFSLAFLFLGACNPYSVRLVGTLVEVFENRVNAGDYERSRSPLSAQGVLIPLERHLPELYLQIQR